VCWRSLQVLYKNLPVVSPRRSANRWFLLRRMSLEMAHSDIRCDAVNVRNRG
jgi:hypothetical protein